MPGLVNDVTRIWELNLYWPVNSQCGIWDPKQKGVDVWECVRAHHSIPGTQSLTVYSHSHQTATTGVMSLDDDFVHIPSPDLARSDRVRRLCSFHRMNHTISSHHVMQSPAAHALDGYRGHLHTPPPIATPYIPVKSQSAPMPRGCSHLLSERGSRQSVPYTKYGALTHRGDVPSLLRANDDSAVRTVASG